MRKLLVGVDGSERSFDALRWGHRLAGAVGAELTAVVAGSRDAAAAFDIPGDDVDGHAISEACEKRIADMGLAGTTTSVVDGSPSAVLHEAAAADAHRRSACADAVPGARGGKLCAPRAV